MDALPHDKDHFMSIVEFQEVGVFCRAGFQRFIKSTASAILWEDEGMINIKNDVQSLGKSILNEPAETF